MGAWSVLKDFVQELAEQIGCEHPVPRYAGRPTSASPATGSMSVHRRQQAALLDEALTVGLKASNRIAAKRGAEEEK